MSSKVQLISVICFLSYSVIIGALVFSRGFLLNRQVLTNKAGPCLDTRYRHHYHEGHQNNSLSLAEHGELPVKELLQNLTEAANWCHQSPPLFKKSILVLVDALRHDFVQRMPFLREQVRKHRDLQHPPSGGKRRREEGGSSCLFRFVADPPTTTMQRLKALMTGTMPTFIDASANFNRYSLISVSLLCLTFPSVHVNMTNECISLLATKLKKTALSTNCSPLAVA